MAASQRSSQLHALKRFLWSKHISEGLTLKIQRSAKHALARQRCNISESSIEVLSSISEPLRTELHFEEHYPVLSVHPFLRMYQEQVPTTIKRLCHEAIQRHQFSSGDVVFSEGEAPSAPRMFFISSGRLHYHRSNVRHANTSVKNTNWVSEPALWTVWSYRGTLQAATECALISLDANKFATIANKIPVKSLCVYARIFCEDLSITLESELSDVAFESATFLDMIRSAFPEKRRHRLSTIVIPTVTRTSIRTSVTSIVQAKSSAASERRVSSAMVPRSSKDSEDADLWKPGWRTSYEFSDSDLGSLGEEHVTVQETKNLSQSVAGFLRASMIHF